MIRRKSVFVYSLGDSGTMHVMNKHLVSNGIKGASLRTMSSKDDIYSSYKIDIDAEYYDKICDSSLWGSNVHVRDKNKRNGNHVIHIFYIINYDAKTAKGLMLVSIIY